MSRSLKLGLGALLAGVSIFALWKTNNPGTQNEGEASERSLSTRRVDSKTSSERELTKSERDFLKVLETKFEEEDYAGLISHAKNFEGDGMVLWNWTTKHELPYQVAAHLLDESMRLLVDQLDKETIFNVVLDLTDEKVKSRVVTRFFSRAPIEAGEFESFITRLEKPVQQSNCAKQYGSNLGRPKVLNSEALKVLASSEFGKMAVLAGLTKHPMMLTREPLSAKKTRLEDSFANAKSLLESGHLDEAMYQKFLEVVVQQVPSESYEYFQEQNELNSLSESAIEKLAAAMSIRSYRDVLSDEFGLFKEADIGTAVFQLARNDRWEADNWMEDNFENLSPEHQSHAQQAFSVLSATEKKFDSAWEWIDQIQDATSKQDAIKQVSGYQTKAVHAEVEKNPQGTLEGIVSGESVHRSPWIKEAFDQWGGDDSAAAMTWYDQNKTDLTPEQNQHVARSLADEAIKAGQMDTAAEWLDQVIDQRYRSEIESRLQDSESE